MTAHPQKSVEQGLAESLGGDEPNSRLRHGQPARTGLLDLVEVRLRLVDFVNLLDGSPDIDRVAGTAHPDLLR